MMARRSHPFPYRTRKLSFSAPMVVKGCPFARVGRCRAKKKSTNYVLFFVVSFNFSIIKKGPLFFVFVKKVSISGKSLLGLFFTNSLHHSVSYRAIMLKLYKRR